MQKPRIWFGLALFLIVGLGRVAFTAPWPAIGATVPPGTDLALRLRVTELNAGAKAAMKELSPLVPGVAGAAGEGRVRSVERVWQELEADLARFCRADLTRPGVIASVAIDADAPGGQVYSAVIYNALSPGADGAPSRVGNAENYKIDGVTAYRVGKLHWAVLEDTREKAPVLVIGDERGVQRHVRCVAHNECATKEPIGKLPRPGNVPGKSPGSPNDDLVEVAFVAPAAAALPELVPDLGVLLARANAGAWVFGKDRLSARLQTGAAKDQKILRQGLLATFGAVRASAALAQASGDLLAGLRQAQEKSQWLPEKLKPTDVEPIAKGWAKDFSLVANVYDRPGNALDVEAEVSSFRAVALAAVALARGASGSSDAANREIDLEKQASALLMGLRAAELLHKEVNGEFVACRPTPKEIPVEPQRWPEERCFARMAFAPSTPVGVQLEAQVVQGRLLLIARARPDRDGPPQVWYVDDQSTMVRGVRR